MKYRSLHLIGKHSASELFPDLIFLDVIYDYLRPQNIVCPTQKYHRTVVLNLWVSTHLGVE